MFLRSFQRSFSRSAHFLQCYRSAVPCPSVTLSCTCILYIQAPCKQQLKQVVIKMTIVYHGQDCNSILLSPTTSGANELIVFRSHSVCNFQFKFDLTDKKLTWTCIPCYAVRIRLLKLLATRERMKDTKHGESIKLIVFSIHGNPTANRDCWCAIDC